MVKKLQLRLRIIILADTIDILGKEIAKLKKRVADLEAMQTDTLDWKDTTGDFASGNFEGRRVANTFDNNYKIYLEGSFRTIINW